MKYALGFRIPACRQAGRICLPVPTSLITQKKSRGKLEIRNLKLPHVTEFP